ncbi:MAG TPA: adenosine deaminase [Candidatus Acidoferrales bacterium]|nr:adenosine deaminase [Candidatus Acidoferrales bacterium]
MTDYRKLAKVELHCHLDCSVRVATVAELGRELGLKLPEPLNAALTSPEVCADLADYISRVHWMLEVMQRREHLTRIAREFAEDLSADGVVYGEARFAPQLHTRAGLTMHDVLDAISEGIAEGSRTTRVKIGLILCCLRHEDPEVSLLVARLAVKNAESVCGIDLAGDEARYPGAPHRAAFELACEAGLRRTVHAGEAAGAESIKEAIEVLGAERIGHGVRIEESPEMVESVRRRGIALEMCPLSNYQTRAVETLAGHPIDRLLKQQLRVTVSTDCRTISRTTVSAEFERLEKLFGWGHREFAACQRNAAEAAFVSSAGRKEIAVKLGI